MSQLYTGNLLTQTNTYSGTVTTTSQQSLVLSTPSPIGPKLHVAILSFSTRRRPTSGRHLPTYAHIPNGLLTRWRKGSTCYPERLLMELTARAPQVPSTLPMKSKPRVTLLYLTHKVSVKVSGSVGGMGIQTLHFKGSNTIRNLLVSPKDKDPMFNQRGAIYWFQCGDLTCDDEYIGETIRIFGERFKEHLKDPSPIHHHSTHTGHPTSHNNFQIIGREGGAWFS